MSAGAVVAGAAPSPQQADLIRWVGSLGAVSAEALALREEVALASARTSLALARRRGWLDASRPLAGRPTLYTATRTGLRAARMPGVVPARVSPAGAAHLLACAGVAAVLERRYADHRLVGERELRRDEREQGRALASADLGHGPHGQRLLHRCDLVLWPAAGRADLPVAVEVELTAKAPARLAAICRGWARCRLVAGVLYVAAPEVTARLQRAIERARAGERIVVVSLATLNLPEGVT